MKLELIIQSEVSQKKKKKPIQYTNAYNRIYKDGNDDSETEKETQMYRTVFWTLWERARAG